MAEHGASYPGGRRGCPGHRAADLGIGSGHSAVTDQQQAQRVLGFPAGYFAVFMIGLGYPADRPLGPLAQPNRRPFDEVVRWDHW